MGGLGLFTDEITSDCMCMLRDHTVQEMCRSLLNKQYLCVLHIYLLILYILFLLFVSVRTNLHIAHRQYSGRRGMLGAGLGI